MDKERRQILRQGIGLSGAAMGIPATEHQTFIADIQHVLRRHPSSGPGDKELRYLEQKIMLYWQARNNVVLAPTDLILHVDEYLQDVMALLDRSLLPSVRTRLCACLSQGMLLIGHCLDGMKQFQTARRYYHTAVEAAHEAKYDILQALAWYRNSRSWSYGNGTNRYEQARESMLKACDFASLGSDFAVQCVTRLGLAEVYAYLKEKEACLEALKRADKLGGSGTGDWYFIHLFDSASLNGYRGACLQQFDQSDLLEEARQALEEVLSQPDTGVLRAAFCMADMAQVCAREGKVESACGYARQVMSIAETNASLRQSLLAVRILLEPYADVEAVRDLEMQMRESQLQG
jgi:tetratricopeptide (TPR) repeat protein